MIERYFSNSFVLDSNMKLVVNFNPILNQMATLPKRHYQQVISSLVCKPGKLHLQERHIRQKPQIIGLKMCQGPYTLNHRKYCTVSSYILLNHLIKKKKKKLISCYYAQKLLVKKWSSRCISTYNYMCIFYRYVR